MYIKRMVAGVLMVVIFTMILFAPAISSGYMGSNQVQLPDSPIICTQHSNLIIETKNVSSGLFSSINSIDTGYFNVTQTYYYNYHGLEHDIACNVLGKVTGNTGGCTIITQQFSYVITASNSTGTFKEYNGYVVMKNLGFSWDGSYTHNYVAMNVNLEIYSNGDVFMQYSIAYSRTPSEISMAFIDITGLVKNMDC
ncbi:hypothetical protein [Ferroplasma acidiphilum]|jgi:hypothetical protein|uniref:hypothetical protein n=2 Tax=Ferroplasma acidiphilum TaxID=74969 RepID=UPI0023F0E13A|nr:hypothetical protein [Ferroplasma acidiphilum]